MNFNQANKVTVSRFNNNSFRLEISPQSLLPTVLLYSKTEMLKTSWVGGGEWGQVLLQQILFPSKIVLQARASVIMNHCSWWEPRIEVTCIRQETWEIIWQIGGILSILTQLRQLTGFISSKKFDEEILADNVRADRQGEGDCRKWISDNKKTHIFSWHLSALSALFIEVKIQVQKFNSGPGQNQLISISSECQNLSLQIQNVKYYPGDPNSVFSLTEYFLFQLWQSNHSNRQAGTWDLQLCRNLLTRLKCEEVPLLMWVTLVCTK